MWQSMSTMWWLAAGALVVAELLSGTFYLLMLALGAAAGALAAHAGLNLNTQIACAALLGGGAMAAWHLRRGRQPTGKAAAENPDVLLDVGSQVQVARWHADGTARVSYRGAEWAVRYVGPAPAAAGAHVIRSMHGNQLQLDRVPD